MCRSLSLDSTQLRKRYRCVRCHVFDVHRTAVRCLPPQQAACTSARCSQHRRRLMSRSHSPSSSLSSTRCRCCDVYRLALTGASGSDSANKTSTNRSSNPHQFFMRRLSTRRKDRSRVYNSSVASMDNNNVSDVATTAARHQVSNCNVRHPRPTLPGDIVDR